MGNRSTGSSPAGPVAVLEHGGSRWRVGRGQEITIGRSSACTIKLPDDTYLSRHMALLRVLDDCVLVYNKSQSKPFLMRPPVGADRIVEPGAAMTSLPFPRFDIVVVRGGGATVTIQVDASAVTQDSMFFGSTTLSESKATIGRPIRLTPAQLDIIIELCRPLLTRCGADARPATYKEIGERLGRGPMYVRNVISDVRREVRDRSAPGLTDWEDLAHWMILNRVVTERHLDRFQREDTRPLAVDCSAAPPEQPGREARVIGCEP
ncbi:hypothetical protein UG55_10889 [Frankia sp. EI5c]|uniref:FHA domain-containing protein n=1 Tax=Frankia sp. EI5c TaxID=683316 RepID=UPI0007C233A2|nr:FHA domain-containing protein [Frankia sp. EI5c]OAA19605.1 hypothetical protein UG55_10889 [Frankia sp. EI5c]